MRTPPSGSREQLVWCILAKRRAWERSGALPRFIPRFVIAISSIMWWYIPFTLNIIQNRFKNQPKLPIGFYVLPLLLTSRMPYAFAMFARTRRKGSEDSHSLPVKGCVKGYTVGHYPYSLEVLFSNGEGRSYQRREFGWIGSITHKIPCAGYSNKLRE